jgi:hypothetical protein
MRLQLLLIPIISITLITSCKNKIELQEFDTARWIADKGGCTGDRKELALELVKIKSRFKGHSSDDVVATLGKPDKEDLHSRNQKFYYYFIEPGPHCTNKYLKSESDVVTFRISAMNRVTEVNFQLSN